MYLSDFLAQIIGLYLVITNLSFLIHLNRSKKMTLDFASNYPLIILSGAISLILGLLIVISHNVWIAHWPIVVTIVGWIALLQGVFRLFLPEYFAKMCKDLVANQGFLLLSWLWLLVGFYLLWAGFSQV